LIDQHTPLLWGYKPTVWQFLKIDIIVQVIVVFWIASVFSILVFTNTISWPIFILIIGGIIVPYLLMMIFVLGFVRMLNGFDSISEKDGIVLLRSGFGVSSIVIPWSKAYPMTSSINLKDGSGYILFYKYPMMLMKGPEVLVREEIIFNKYSESTIETEQNGTH